MNEVKIKQVITELDTVFLFTENPENDIEILQKAYENRDEASPLFPLGYEAPTLIDYDFLGNKYKCISLWFDNEDVPNYMKYLS